MESNNYSKLFKVSTVFGILWLFTCLFSIIESVLVGLGICFAPTAMFSFYCFVQSIVENPKDIIGAFLISFEALFALPLVLVFSSFIFFPVVILVLLFYGISFWAGVIYSGASIIMLVISLVFAILLFANTSVSQDGVDNNDKAMKIARVFVILGLISLIIAGAPNVFSIISILRYIFIIVACVTALVGVSKSQKLNTENS